MLFGKSSAVWAGALLLSLLMRVHPAAAAAAGWVGTWATVPTAVPATNVTTFEDQTVREVVHVSVGGDALRLRLSNEFGDQPLTIGEAHVARAVAGHPEQITAGSDRRLTFGGRTSTVVPAGAPELTDPVALHVPAFSDLVVSIYLPQRTAGTTIHAFSFQDNVVASGNVTGRQAVTPTATFQQWYFLTGVSVQRSGTGSVVALGDSITDGANTTPDTNRRWPDLLAARLNGTRGVVNEGISGNRLLHDANPIPGTAAENFGVFFGQSALHRFDRDVGAQPGARDVIVLLGVNDLGQPGTGDAPASEEVTADDLINGFQQLIARAHERGLKIYGATITPFADDTFGFFTPEREVERQAVNQWVRTSGAYDGVIDFDAVMRDPAEPDRLDPRFDSGDHLHPNDAGAAALADAVPLRLLR